jgi:type II secretory pathway pseudopilin PulG
MSVPPPPPPVYQPVPPRSGFPVWIIVLLIAGLFFLAIVGVLAAIAIPNFRMAQTRARVTRDLSNMRQLSMAIIRMDLDRAGDKNSELGYPGDLADSAKIKLGQPAPVRTVSDYLQRMVAHDYLSAAEIQKLTARSPEYSGWAPNQPGAGKNCGVKIYKCRDQDSGDTLALAAREFSYGTRLKSTAMYPLAHKDGSGLVYRTRDPLTTAGVLPGRKDYNDRPIETPDDTLVQE